PSNAATPSGLPAVRDADVAHVMPAPADAPPAGPDSSRLAFCANCQTHVERTGRGFCAGCGRFLPGNDVALTTGLRRKRPTPEDDARRAVIANEFFAERGGIAYVDIVTQYRIRE